MKKSSFTWPMRLLTGKRYRAIRAIYAFCKVADDIADHPTHSDARKNTALTSLERRVKAGDLSPQLKLALVRYQIRTKLLMELLEGLRWDVNGRTEAMTSEELEKYCYLVAGTVGLMSVRIFGCRDIKSESFALELGQILQRINILRDVDEDARRGRCYLPTDWDNPRAALRADIDERIATLRIPQADRSRLLPALAMLGIYMEWLKQIDRHEKRKPLSMFQKLRGMWRGILWQQGNLRITN